LCFVGAMAEEDVININDDSDYREEDVMNIDNEEVIVIENDNRIENEEIIVIDDDNLMEIADEDVMNISDGEEESEEEVPSLGDSDYVSDNDDELRQKKRRHLNLPEILTLDVTIKMCCITFYYYDMEEGKKYCADCFLRLAFSFWQAESIRKHKTDYSVLLIDNNCVECGKSLYQILPCNMCPICTHCEYPVSFFYLLL